jgi:RNA-directed DNA polymerase
MSVKLESTDLKEKFYSLASFQDLADLLEIPKNKLYYYTYKTGRKDHYKKFLIPKRSGGYRIIYSPSTPLKIIQKKLNQILQAVYTPKASVHGFVNKKSILTNAKRHLEDGKKRYVLNVDLEDFFPSINSQRIAGLLTAWPYNLPLTVAQAIAQLCCHNGDLPQGAPTSPVISNMICAKMDTQIRRLAQRAKCTYTRYADDITISTTLPKFPIVFAQIDPDTNALRLGDIFHSIIIDNDFAVNNKKIRLQTRNDRQEITGIIVNKFPNVRRTYVRQIRAMLHAWKKYGLENAQKEYQEKHHGRTNSAAPSFKKIVRGKLEFLRFVKGEENSTYNHLSKKLSDLDPDYKKHTDNFIVKPSLPIFIITEGKTDWKHLKNAYLKFQSEGIFQGLDIEFWEYEDVPQMGNTELLKRCQDYNLQSKEKINICIFDSDDKDINKKVNNSDWGYQKWGHNFFSFSIPTPEHRIDTPNISLEFYYKDEDIMRADAQGNRLYINSEFNKISCRHLKNEELSCRDLQKITKSPLCIIDNEVYTGQSRNVAMTKNTFAQNILHKVNGFSDVEVEAFKLIFKQIMKILSTEYPKN